MWVAYSAKPAEATSQSDAARTPPGNPCRSPRADRGPVLKRPTMRQATRQSSTGHLRPAHSVSPACATPSRRPSQRASGPVSTRAKALAISSTSSPTAEATMMWAWRSGGRVSFTRCMACIALRKTAR